MDGKKKKAQISLGLETGIGVVLLIAAIAIITAIVLIIIKWKGLV